MTSPKQQKNQATKDPVLNEKPSNIIEIELSIGVAKCVVAKGKHVMQAQRLMDGDPDKMLPSLVATCTSIDGKMITIEELEEMPAKDYMVLMGHFGPALA